MRKVLVPIHIKLVSFFVFILCCAISFYVYYATNLFKTDKTAYIFESVKNHNQNLSDTLKAQFNEKIKTVSILSKFYRSPGVVESIMESDQSLLRFSIYSDLKLLRKYTNRDGVGDQVPDKKIEKLIGEQSKLTGFFNINKSFIIWKKIENEVFILEFDKTKVIDQIKDSKLFKDILIEGENWKVLAGDADEGISAQLPRKHPSTGLNSGVIVKSILGEKYILAFNKPIDQLQVFTLIKESVAFQATETLVQRSLYLGILIVAIVILLILLFSRVFTNPIKKLFESSQEFAKSNFTNEVKLKNRDELGVLADSMNDMRSSILNYMKEMQEKNRLEGEMKTAQLVQKSFFKAKNINLTNASLCGYYKPASECGGDWWGSRHVNGKDIIIIFDATGHGTGAAMATAIAFNCLSAIETLSLNDKALINDPASIMSFLNKSLCEIHGDMMATAFVAVFDSKTKDLAYSNASHNPPLKINYRSEVLSKSDIEPLIKINGRRLGENDNELYQSEIIALADGDKVLFYTDGLTEGQNTKNQDWGQRRFVKSILKHAALNINQFIDGIKADAFEFYEETEQMDDITILALEIGLSKDEFTYEHSFEEVLERWEDLKGFNVFRPKENIDKIKGSGNELAKLKLSGGKSQEIKQKIASLFDTINFESYFGDMRNYLESLALELAENSLVHGGDEAVLKIIEEENRFVIKTEDAAGLLSKEQFFIKLKRAFSEKTFEQKESGAGLGFYLIVHLSDMIEFDLKTGSHTIIECSINKYKRLKQYKQKKITVDFKQNEDL